MLTSPCPGFRTDPRRNAHTAIGPVKALSLSAALCLSLAVLVPQPASAQGLSSDQPSSLRSLSDTLRDHTRQSQRQQDRAKAQRDYLEDMNSGQSPAEARKDYNNSLMLQRRRQQEQERQDRLRKLRSNMP